VTLLLLLLLSHTHTHHTHTTHTHTHTHTSLTAFFLGLPRWAGTRKLKPIWILLKQETVSGSGISWAICKSASHSRQITMPTPHCSVFYRLDALPATQPTASKHWRHKHWRQSNALLLLLLEKYQKLTSGTFSFWHPITSLEGAKLFIFDLVHIVSTTDWLLITPLGMWQIDMDLVVNYTI